MNTLHVRFVSWWVGLARRTRNVVLIDIICCFIASYMGFALRLTLFLPSIYIDIFLGSTSLFCLIVCCSFAAGGMYSVYWPQASVEEYSRLSRLYVIAALVFSLIGTFWRGLMLPRVSLAILLLSGIILCGAVRASWRFFASGNRAPREGIRTLIVGAGEAGTLLARDLSRNVSDLLPVGYVDDDADKKGKTVAGFPVLGSVDRIGDIIREKDVRVVVIAIPSASGTRIRKIFDSIVPTGVEVRVLPSLREIAGGKVSISRLRKVRLEDLLGREPVRLDLEGIAGVIRGRSVLVTGAGGSIGSEIARQAAQYGPKELILLGHGEQSIYTLIETFSREHIGVPYRPVIADVADPVAMEAVFRLYSPALVFHAAAHKHVPLMEMNPREAVRVNAGGTLNVARLAGRYGVEKMLLISTDKAVNPTSVMGATKRVAEMILNDVRKEHPQTAYMAVRFGNVLGSRGSVIPKFEDQISAGMPVTVTHPEMRRYFMLIPEAVSLVLQSAALASGGELFVLDMGDPVRIVDMAEMLIRLHGYEPYRDIPIVFTGIRRGEKLFEELFYDPTRVQTTVHEKIFVSNLGIHSSTPGEVSERVERMIARNDGDILRELESLIPEYTPSAPVSASR